MRLIPADPSTDTRTRIEAGPRSARRVCSGLPCATTGCRALQLGCRFATGAALPISAELIEQHDVATPRS
jgi:hypothetical protein